MHKEQVRTKRERNLVSTLFPGDLYSNSNKFIFDFLNFFMLNFYAQGTS